MKYYGLSEKHIKELKKRRCLTAYIEEVERYCNKIGVETAEWVKASNKIENLKTFIYGSFLLNDSERGLKYWTSIINEKTK